LPLWSRRPPLLAAKLFHALFAKLLLRVRLPKATAEAAMSNQRFPPGCDEQRVRAVIAHYENQSEDEQFAEIEAAREQQDITMMAVPNDLAPEVRALIARRRSA